MSEENTLDIAEVKSLIVSMGLYGDDKLSANDYMFSQYVLKREYMLKLIFKHLLEEGFRSLEKVRVSIANYYEDQIIYEATYSWRAIKNAYIFNE